VIYIIIVGVLFISMIILLMEIIVPTLKTSGNTGLILHYIVLGMLVTVVITIQKTHQ